MVARRGHACAKETHVERTAKNLSPTNAACAEAKPSRNFKAPAPPPLFGSYDTVVRWPSRMGGGGSPAGARSLRRSQCSKPRKRA